MRLKKSEGKTSLLTTHEILLEEGNRKFVSRPAMESYVWTCSDLGAKRSDYSDEEVWLDVSGTQV